MKERKKEFKKERKAGSCLILFGPFVFYLLFPASVSISAYETFIEFSLSVMLRSKKWRFSTILGESLSLIR